MRRIAYIIAGLLLSASAGAVIHASATLQNAYNSSATPKITTNAAAGSVKIQRGSAADTDAALEVLNGSGVSAASVLGNGTLSAASISAVGTLSSTSDQSINGKLLVSATAPIIASGFGTNPVITAFNTAAFRIIVGSGGTATSGVVTLPAAPNGWACWASDMTTQSATVFITKQTADTTTSATFGNFSTAGTAAAWSAGDELHISCRPY